MGGNGPREAGVRAFLDSNVFFSGFYSRKGAPGKILEEAAGGSFRVVVSRQVLDEVVRTLAEKLPGALPFLNAFLVNIPLEVCTDPGPGEVGAWEKVVGRDDAPIAAAAHAADVDLLVSGDRHFLEARSRAAGKGLRITSPAGFLHALAERSQQERR
ncbi:MAG: PIN domain-containing protein [Actinobacteria bacterium]|nr:PIN domain-containing protein [Actinomycetota bacterium]